MTVTQLFFGTAVHAEAIDRFFIIHNALIGVDASGVISQFDCDSNLEQLHALQSQHQIPDDKVTILEGHQFLMPGFIDTHIHAPQYSYTGTAMDKPLLEWLESYTFPKEAKFSDLSYANEVYTKCVKRLLKTGTTTAAYFGTIHVEACKALVDIMRRYGQRGWVGKVCMDTNSPDYYIETGEQAVEGTKELIKYVRETEDGSGLVEACITPRFAPTCTAETLKKLGEIAMSENVPVQSHLSENQKEIEWVRNLFPWADSYTDVYAKSGLLHGRVVMAHCVHLEPEEIKALAGCGISHCAMSNLMICSGFCNVKKLINSQLKVGLGTDVSGGYATSMLEAVRATAINSRIVGNQLTVEEIFYLATLGGASAMGLEHKIGSFSVGKLWDALLIDPHFDVFGDDSWEEKVHKFLFLGDDRSIKNVWINGHLIEI